MKLGQNFVNYFIRFLGNEVSRKNAFEIYWTLGKLRIKNGCPKFSKFTIHFGFQAELKTIWNLHLMVQLNQTTEKEILGSYCWVCEFDVQG